MKFRRTLEVGSPKTIRRKAILMTAGLLIMVLLLVSMVKSFAKPVEKKILPVSFLTDSTYLISQDTTNYDDFASSLKKTVAQYKQKAYPSIIIQVQIPKGKSVAEIQDIVQVVNAFRDGRVATDFVLEN